MAAVPANRISEAARRAHGRRRDGLATAVAEMTRAGRRMVTVAAAVASTGAAGTMRER